MWRGEQGTKERYPFAYLSALEWIEQTVTTIEPRSLYVTAGCYANIARTTTIMFPAGEDIAEILTMHLSNKTHTNARAFHAQLKSGIGSFFHE